MSDQSRAVERLREIAESGLKTLRETWAELRKLLDYRWDRHPTAGERNKRWNDLLDAMDRAMGV